MDFRIVQKIAGTVPRKELGHEFELAAAAPHCEPDLTGFERHRPEGDIPDTKVIMPEALKIIRTEVDPRGVFTTMPKE